jgi:hypothetical protein
MAAIVIWHLLSSHLISKHQSSISSKPTNTSQVTGPVQRFARQIASHGYIVAAPSSYHEFTGPEALAYDGPGTDAGNAWKIEKKLSAYDEDATLSVDLLTSMETCNGRIGATGMCLGGHLAFRCAFDKRIRAAVCYFATDIHSQTLGKGKNDDSIKRVKDISGELIMVRSVLSNQSSDLFRTNYFKLSRSSARKTLTSHQRAVISSARPCTMPA